jgi:hypothetical protein
MNYKHTAIIIEPRKHKALWFVIDNALENLSNEWKIILFHGTKNEEYAKNIAVQCNSPRLQLVGLPVENLNQRTYSEVLSTPSVIYDYIDTEYFLIFQTDSLIIKKNKDKMNAFLEMNIDYVGAPWLRTEYSPTKERDFIGNGGFSLRKTSTMKKIIELHPYDPNGVWYEDLYFTTPFPDIQIKKPTYSMAKQFCVDEVYDDSSLAVHQPWVHTHYSLLKKLHPEVEVLRHLQGIED